MHLGEVLRDNHMKFFVLFDGCHELLRNLDAQTIQLGKNHSAKSTTSNPTHHQY